jgi:hypothetical protein
LSTLSTLYSLETLRPGEPGDGQARLTRAELGGEGHGLDPDDPVATQRRIDTGVEDPG